MTKRTLLDMACILVFGWIGGPGCSLGPTTPSAAYDSIEAPILSASFAPPQWHRPPRGERRTPYGLRETWQFWPLLGTRILVGGDAKDDDITEVASFLLGFSAGPNLPIGETQALGPYFHFLYSRVEDDTFDFGWDIYTLGGGVRWLFVYGRESDLYFMADFGYTRWEGRGSDFFFGGRIEPRDLDGYSVGVGIGGDLFFNDRTGMGFQVAHRWYDGTLNLTARWIDAGFVFAFRY